MSSERYPGPLPLPDPRLRRRAFLGSVAAGGAFAAGATLIGGDALAQAKAPAKPSLVAVPPAGFVPLDLPGRIVKVTRGNTMQANGLWPTEEAAQIMLERAMTELTGKSDIGQAFARFVHKDDKVAIKPNGIAGQKGATMAANKELVLAVVRGVIAAGVPAENISVFEQYPSFMAGTRVADRAGVMDKDFPPGIRAFIHKNEDASMPSMTVGGIPTKFVTPFTDATAVINVTLIKDHSICGYTGCMKNITHGAQISPHSFHEHNASPQIAHLYAQDLVKSRVRLHITDGFKVIYDEGPLDKNKKRRVLHEAVYATTDPVAMDVIGWGVIEQLRKENGLPTLKQAKREPLYIQNAGEMGLGVFDKNQIRMREIAL
jgi:uncharacterized protein (DUF362 family)